MASGDVIVEITGAYVAEETSNKQGSQNFQNTVFKGGTRVAPSAPRSFSSATISVYQNATSSSPAAETLFDSGKQYTIKVVEV